MSDGRIQKLAFLRESLPAAEALALDAHDPRFIQITDLAQAGDATKAADEALELLVQKYYDVRLLGYPIHRDFQESGPAVLAEALETLEAALRNNDAALGPREKRGVVLNKTLSGLLQTVLDAIDYRRHKDDAVWKAWLKKLEPELAKQAAERARSLSGLLTDPVYRQSAELLARLGRTMDDLAARAAPEPVREITSAEAGKNTAEAGAADPAPAASSNFALPGQVVQLRGSAKFIELRNKLRAFEVLIEKQDFRRAAMVGDDVLSLLSAFDPRIYFPELFATFSALLNANVQQMKSHWDTKTSIEWKMLQQFYQVDLERFTRGE